MTRCFSKNILPIDVLRRRSVLVEEKDASLTVELQPLSNRPHGLFFIPCDKEIFRLFLTPFVQIKSVIPEGQGSLMICRGRDL